jgi:hypothetical protein
MPSWGRPPGARGGKRRKGWEQAQDWDAQRVEELDSDDDEDGVRIDLDPRQQPRRFVSDEHRFAGVDPRQGHAQDYDYDNTTESSENEDKSLAPANLMQVALRDKEEMLVQQALARIRRAQAKGKSNVKLTQPQLEALERKERSAAAAPIKSKKSNSKPGSERSKKAAARAPVSALMLREPSKGKKKSKSPPDLQDDTPLYSTGAMQPGFMAAELSGSVQYPPLGYYNQSAVRPPSSRGKARSSLGPQQSGHVPVPPQYQHEYQRGRYSSMPEGYIPSSSSSPRTTPTRTPLPHEPGWKPGSRRNSTARGSPQDPYQGIDPFQYQTYAPPSPQPQYSSVRRNPGTYPVLSRSAANASDQSLTRRQRRVVESSSEDSSESEEEFSESEEDSDDADEGVQVHLAGEPVIVNTGARMRSRKGRR